MSLRAETVTSVLFPETEVSRVRTYLLRYNVTYLYLSKRAYALLSDHNLYREYVQACTLVGAALSARGACGRPAFLLPFLLAETGSRSFLLEPAYVAT